MSFISSTLRFRFKGCVFIPWHWSCLVPCIFVVNWCLSNCNRRGTTDVIFCFITRPGEITRNRWVDNHYTDCKLKSRLIYKDWYIYYICISLGTWWRHQMATFSALLAICAGNSPVSGEFPAQKPVTRGFGVFSYLRPDKRLSKQSWGWWFETPSHSLWRHRNEKR